MAHILIQRLNDSPQWMRILVAAAGVLALIGLWYQFSFTQVTTEKQRLLDENDKLSEHLSSVKGITSNSSRLVYEKHIISAEDLANLLSSLLQQNGDLELITLEKIPVAIPDEVPEKVRGLHKVLEQKITATDIVLNVRGSYFSILKYLKSAEQEAGVGIFWKSIDYVVDKYPVAEVQIIIRTLGTRS